MTRSARLLLALALAGTLTAVKAVAAGSIPSSNFTVTKGEVTAVVDGQTKTFKKGDKVPDQAVVTATADAEVASTNGMSIQVSKGTSYQAAYTKDGLVDIKVANGSAKVQGFGNSYVLGAGAEGNFSPGTAQVISGSVSHTDSYGNTSTMKAGEQVTKTGIRGDFTLVGAAANGTFTTILVPPAPPTQQTTVAPVSPSAP